MDIRLNLGELKTPSDIQKLVSAISEMADSLDTLVSTTAPNGNISGRQGQKCLYNNSGTYTVWINTTGSTVWQQIGAESFVTGDWIISSVATARTGWTNVSATYSNKFMRINATPLTTGGVDTHTTPSHTLTTTEMPAHTHDVNAYDGGGSGNKVSYVSNANNLYVITAAASSTGGGGGHTHAAADNVPVYVQVCIFQKD